MLVIFFAILALGTSGLYLGQEKLFMHPIKSEASLELKTVSAKFEEHYFNDANGDRIHFVRIFGTKENNRTLLFFHGNSGNIFYSMRYAEMLSAKTKSDVWMVDYPGYGKSNGTIRSQVQLEDIALRSLDFLKSRSNSKIIVLGFSMGTYLASYVAQNPSVSGLILEAPYKNAQDKVHDVSAIFPTWLLRYDLANDKLVGKVSFPILIIQGDKDEVVAAYHSKKLFELAPQNSSLVYIKGGMHNDLASYEEYWVHILRYVSSI